MGNGDHKTIAYSPTEYEPFTSRKNLIFFSKYDSKRMKQY